MDQGLTAAAEKIIPRGPTGYATRSRDRTRERARSARTAVITLEHMESWKIHC